MRLLTRSEIDIVAGGWGESSITVSHPPYDDWPPYYDPGYDSPGGSAGGSGGGDGGDPGDPADSSHEAFHHDKTCSTPSGAAVQIADHIKGVGEAHAPYYNQGNWTKWEFTAIVTKNADGTYGALNQSVYSNGSDSFSINPSARNTESVGIIHNHPDGIGGPASDLNQRYPSDEDWRALEKLSEQTGTTDPSLWLMDARGDVREFHLSDKSAMQALSDTDRQNGVGLAGRERTQSCG